MSEFEKCPNCGTELQLQLSDIDYETDLEWDCPHCDCVLDVTVHMVPEFEFKFNRVGSQK